VAVIEAGTGTGKSLAYLLPALLWAVRNRSGGHLRNTINLEQLRKKDILSLRKHCGVRLQAVW
jgi:ATP-dependent DNA helicase DinG